MKQNAIGFSFLKDELNIIELINYINPTFFKNYPEELDNPNQINLLNDILKSYNDNIIMYEDDNIIYIGTNIYNGDNMKIILDNLKRVIEFYDKKVKEILFTISQLEFFTYDD